MFGLFVNPLSANPTKWPNTLKQFVGNSLTNCLSVFDHFVKLMLKGLNKGYYSKVRYFSFDYICQMEKILTNPLNFSNSVPLDFISMFLFIDVLYRCLFYARLKVFS